MNEPLVVLTVIAPLVPVILWPAKRWRGWMGRLGLIAPLPAILLVAANQHVMVDLPGLLLGSRWGMDATGRVFLGFTAVLWLASGVFGRTYLARDPRRDRFELFWLLTMCGNLGVIVAQDIVSFLLFFTLMSFAAYGLIVHDRQPEGLRAGRIYIMLAVVGEVLLFWGAVLAAHQAGSLYFDDVTAGVAGSPIRGIIVGLVLVGLGIKLGMMPLHMWLALAHPAAPTPASAVLSGAMIKAGLLGLLRFLPLGEVAIYEWGVYCMVVGIASAFVAAFIGLVQHNPKTVLAYSSVSQMGLVTIMLGAALMSPSAWTMIRSALLVFAVHHAVTKAALFLGVGVAQARIESPWNRRLVAGGLVLPALALAGLPLTSGFAAKNALKYATGAAPEFWAGNLEWIIPLTGISTTLLVCRFLYVVWPSRQQSHQAITSPLVIAWGSLTAGVVAVFIALHFGGFVAPTWTSLAIAKTWAAAWPMIAAGIVVFVLWAYPPWSAWLRKVRIPPGDIVVPLTFVSAWCLRMGRTFFTRGISTQVGKIKEQFAGGVAPHLPRVLSHIERRLDSDLTAGLLAGLLAVVMFALMFFGGW